MTQCSWLVGWLGFFWERLRVRPGSSSSCDVFIIGGGPAGLTAAYELQRHGIHSIVIIEGSDVVGGISRTETRNGWRFDIGGHRFFTKVSRVEDFWHQILADGDFLMRPRMSRIYYEGKFYDYPLRASNALKNLGLGEAVACIGSYIAVRLKPPKDQSTFEGWVASRFGWRLYRTFFKTYTEKVWGVPATEIQADWAAQRIKNLSLGKAVWRALMPKGRNSTDVTSLIEQFQYPKYGPGMMWEACAKRVKDRGAHLRMEITLSEIQRTKTGLRVHLSDGNEIDTQHVISSMAINELVRVFTPKAPDEVLAAANRLKHRDFLTAALVLPEDFAFPDNWIYIHSPEVRVGRVQNYGSWSPYLVKEGRTCLGMEYFVTIGDDLWTMPDDELIKLAKSELEALGLASATAVEEGYVVRYPKAYPVYDSDYATSLKTIREFLKSQWPDVYPIGRNGMHRYNNQDHSMLTAMITADNIALSADEDVWDVNVDEEYHEEGSTSEVTRGTGRSAPLVQT